MNNAMNFKLCEQFFAALRVLFFIHYKKFITARNVYSLFLKLGNDVQWNSKYIYKLEVALRGGP